MSGVGFRASTQPTRSIQVENEFIGFVGFTIEMLPLFIKIKDNENFYLFNEFK
ncbi:hypothetical protein [Limnothrix sp. PR1529]|uniref:hypothetical protein n=1 Tax=Limnothrix sp. PR1529 TaxID=1704291 RepID=UPI001303F6E5|nr:hypothetical protein [Limnothrix sp. PR1529]